MKKALSLILALVLCLSLCACGEDKKSNEIELTLDNYNQYLNIDVDFVDGNIIKLGKWIIVDEAGYDGVDAYIDEAMTSFGCYAEVEGVSQNFNYNDVKVTIEVSGKYKARNRNDLYKVQSIESFSLTINSSTNIAGGSINNDKVYYTIPNNMAVARGMTAPIVVDYEFKVVSISGTLTPA